MRRHEDDFWQAHPTRDADDPEDFYDWLAEERDRRKAMRVGLIILAGAICGLLVGLFILIFAVVA